jgi:hypothetical protein
MATFQITIDDSLAPGIIAIASLEGKTPEDVVNEAAAAAATKACQDFKVGPYYTGPTPPQFNADGTPYVAPEPPLEVEPSDFGGSEVAYATVPDQPSPTNGQTYTDPDTGIIWVYSTGTSSWSVQP